jgi:hypothetical protein
LPRVEALSIRFVRAAADRVVGELNPYLDPNCGCRLKTTFEGVLENNAIVGTFTSLHLTSGEIQKGAWRVVRTQR